MAFRPSLGRAESVCLRIAAVLPLFTPHTWHFDGPYVGRIVRMVVVGRKQRTAGRHGGARRCSARRVPHLRLGRQ